MTTIKELHNPEKITGVLLKNGDFLTIGDNQGFQTYPKSIELWERLKDGRLFRIQRWLNKSIICTYKDLEKTKN